MLKTAGANRAQTGGSIDNTPIGATTPSTGAFTTLSATGVATFAAGTVALPPITTSGDTNTGVYFPAADTVGVTTGGAQRGAFSSTGLAVTGGFSATSGINSTTIGATTATTGAFTTVSASGQITANALATTFRFNTNWGIRVNRATPSTDSEGIYFDGGIARGYMFGRQAGSDDLVFGSDDGGSFLENMRIIATGGLAVTGTLSATGVVTFSNYGAGAATFSAAGVISSVSDETWKTKDGVPTDPDAMLKKLAPGYWYYNDEKKKTFGADRQLGFYAQNVNAAIGPEAAPEPEEGKPWGYYDRSVLAVTVMSLQKALATIESLESRITALESK